MPALQDLRKALPGAQIDWVVERGFAPLVRRCAGVGRVLECELRRWRQAPFSAPTREAWHRFKTELQLEAYDAVIDLQGLTKSALISWLARLAPGGKRYSLANQTGGSSFEAPARWVADVAISVPTHIHAVARSRELCAQAMRYPIPDRLSFGLLVSTGAAAAVVPGAMATGGSVVALVHGTSRANKAWPLAHWRALGQRFNDRGYAIALPQASAAEQQVAQDIAGALANAVVWPRLELDALTDALSACVGVVGVDSGLSHIAVALDLAHVQIYNFDTAWRTGPMAFQSGFGRELPTGTRQCSVFAQPTPSVDAVWQAWLAVSNCAMASSPVAAV